MLAKDAHAALLDGGSTGLDSSSSALDPQAALNKTHGATHTSGSRQHAMMGSHIELTESTFAAFNDLDIGDSSGTSRLGGLSRYSVCDTYLNQQSSAPAGSHGDRVLRLRRSFSLSRDSHHTGMMEGRSLSQLRNSGFGQLRKHPLSQSLPALDGELYSTKHSLNGRIKRKRPRAGLRPAPRTKAEKELLFHGERGSIFAKYAIKPGLPNKSRSRSKKRLYPSGFAGKRAAKSAKLYPLRAKDEMDAIRSYHTMSAQLSSVEQLSLSLMSFAEETVPPLGVDGDNYLPDTSTFDLPELSMLSDSNHGGAGGLNKGNISALDPEIQHPEAEDGNCPQNVDHFSNVGAFGMTYDEIGQGHGSSDFGSDAGKNHVIEGGSQLHRDMMSGPEGANDVGTGPFRYIVLASSAGTTNCNLISSADQEPARSQAQLSSFCPATPHGRRLFREQEKALKEQKERLLRAEKIEEMLEKSKPFKGPSFGEGLKKKSSEKGPRGNENDSIASSVTMRDNSSSRRRRRLRSAQQQVGDSLVSSKVHMLPADTHGWGHSAPPSAVRLEASVVGTDTLDQLPIAVRRWEVGMSIPPEESVVIGSANSGGFSMSTADRNADCMRLSPPGFGGGIASGGAMVLDNGASTSNVFHGSIMHIRFPVTESEENNSITESNATGTFLTESLLENDSSKPETTNINVNDDRDDNVISPTESIGEVGAWEETESGKDSVFKPIGSLSSVGRLNRRNDQENNSKSSPQSRKGSRHSSRGSSRQSLKSQRSRRVVSPNHEGRSPDKRTSMQLSAEISTEGRFHTSEKQPKIILRKPIIKSVNASNVSALYQMVTVRVLQNHGDFEKSSQSKKSEKILGGGGGSSTHGLGKAPEERTTKNVQLLVKRNASIVEIVAFVIRTLDISQGVKWNCQYLNRKERRWIILLRNFTAGALASHEFNGLGPDGIHMRLVAPGYIGLKAALKSQRLKDAESSVTSQVPRLLGYSSGEGVSTGSVEERPVVNSHLPSMPSNRAILVETRQREADRPGTTASVISTASDPGAGRRAHKMKSEMNRKQRELDRERKLGEAAERHKSSSGKRFVMRHTRRQEMQLGHDKNSVVSTRNVGADSRIQSHENHFDGWEQTPLFELDGWENENGSSPKFGKKLRSNLQPILGQEHSGSTAKKSYESPREFDTKLEDYSSPDQKRNPSIQLDMSESPKDSPDIDRTHAELSLYENEDVDQPGLRLPYLLASSHLIVDDDIDAGMSGAHTYRNSLASRLRRQKKRMAFRMISQIQLGPQGPRIDKMNILAQKLINGFGKSRVLGGNQFRKARASKAVQQVVEQRLADAKKKKQSEDVNVDASVAEFDQQDGELGGESLRVAESNDCSNSDYSESIQSQSQLGMKSSCVELPHIGEQKSVTFSMDRLYATRKRVPTDVRVSDRSRVLQPVSF